MLLNVYSKHDQQPSRVSIKVTWRCSTDTVPVDLKIIHGDSTKTMALHLSPGLNDVLIIVDAAGDWDRARIRETVIGKSCRDAQASSGGQ